MEINDRKSIIPNTNLCDSSFEEQMEIARKIIQTHKDVLKALHKNEPEDGDGC